jgi:hypothetical protein
MKLNYKSYLIRFFFIFEWHNIYLLWSIFSPLHWKREKASQKIPWPMKFIQWQWFFPSSLWIGILVVSFSFFLQSCMIFLFWSVWLLINKFNLIIINNFMYQSLCLNFIITVKIKTNCSDFLMKICAQICCTEAAPPLFSHFFFLCGVTEPSHPPLSRDLTESARDDPTVPLVSLAPSLPGPIAHPLASSR